MSLRDIQAARVANSLGPDRKAFCHKCKKEQEVFPGGGNQNTVLDLHCVECGTFLARLRKGKKKFDVDITINTNRDGSKHIKVKGKKKK